MREIDRYCIMSQIKDSFESKPNISGTIHGVRRIVQGQRGKSTSLFPSRKAGGAIALESRLELAYAISLEKDPAVKNYRTQALVVPLPGNKYSVPDFVVQMSNGDLEVHEIKPFFEHLSSVELERLNMVDMLINKFGIKFRVVDSLTLPSRREVEKTLALYSHGHSRVWTNLQQEQSLRLLINASLNGLDEAYQILSMNGLPIQLASFHLFYGRIFIGAGNSSKEKKYEYLYV